MEQMCWCGGSPKDITCSISILHWKWCNWEGGREESHISNCWLSLILLSLHSVWNALVQWQSCLKRGKKRIFYYNSKWNSLCNCNCFLFHQLHLPCQENETGKRLGSNLNTCWQAIALRLHLQKSKNVKLLYPLSLTWFPLRDFPSAGNHMSNYLSTTWNHFWLLCLQKITWICIAKEIRNLLSLLFCFSVAGIRCFITVSMALHYECYHEWDICENNMKGFLLICAKFAAF